MNISDESFDDGVGLPADIIESRMPATKVRPRSDKPAKKPVQADASNIDADSARTAKAEKSETSIPAATVDTRRPFRFLNAIGDKISAGVYSGEGARSVLENPDHFIGTDGNSFTKIAQWQENTGPFLGNESLIIMVPEHPKAQVVGIALSSKTATAASFKRSRLGQIVTDWEKSAR